MSLFSNLLGGSGANVGALTRKQSSLIDRSNALAQLLMSNYQENARGGAYDPNAQLDLLRRDHAYGTQVATNNAAASARILGYKPGDTAPVQAMNAISARGRLDYDRLANQIRANATAAQSQALSNAVGGAGSLYGGGIGAYGNQIGQAMAQDAQDQGLFGSLLSTAMPFLGGGALTLPRARKRSSTGGLGMGAGTLTGGYGYDFGTRG